MKWSPLRVAGYAAVAGFVIAIGVDEFVILTRSFDLSANLRYEIENVMLIVWPTSLMMMATDRSTPMFSLFALLISALVNAGLYAVLGTFGWGIARVFRQIHNG
jgi:hypothetical protein